MGIPVTCDSCGARFKAPDSAAGKKGKCSKCGARIVVPAPAVAAAAVAPAEDDLYDLAGDSSPPPIPTRPPPAPAYHPSPTAAAAPAPAPASTMSAAMMSRGVVPRSPNAGAWKKSNNPPTIMKVLALLGGGFLILLGLLFVAGPIMQMMSDKTGKTIRFKGVFIGVALIATGVTTIAKAFAKDDD